MVSMLQCLFRFCCGGAEDDDSDREANNANNDRRASPNRSSAMTRVRTSVRSGYQEASQDEDLTESTECRTSVDGAEGGSSHAAGIREFFTRLRERWRKYEETVVPAGEETTDDVGRPLVRPENLKSIPPPSPLRAASQFDTCGSGIPTIHPEEVVLPGSDLQNQMAKAAGEHLKSHEDECVICMETFDPTNPRMPTLCGCGENKTFFHLPCLYQWVEQSRNCPSCRQRLRWEEF